MLLSGCSPESRQKALSFVFDGVPDPEKPPPPPTRRARRDLLREIEELKQRIAEAREVAKAPKKAGAEEGEHPAAKAKTWEEAVALLPTDDRGNVDWVQAVKAGTIAPQASPDGTGPPQAVLDLDAEMATSGSKLFVAAFSHAAHTAWLTCGSCHPKVFPLKLVGKPPVVTMARMRTGQSCGVCHGRVSFGLDGQCARCHTKIPARTEWRAPEPAKPIEGVRTWAEAEKLLPVSDGVPNWAKALADTVIAPRPGLGPDAAGEDVLDVEVVRTPGGDAAAKVVFPHGAHTAVLKCDSCHPSLFEMEAGATKMSMEKIEAGQGCGLCHGTVAFPPSACGRCHPAMAEGK